MKKKNKEKPYKSLLSNICWNIKRTAELEPSILGLNFIRNFIKIIESYCAVYLPALVVAEVTGNQAFSHVAMSVGFVMLFLFIGDIGWKTLYFIIENKKFEIFLKYSQEVTNKSLTFFYQDYENKKIRDLSERAIYCISMWDSVRIITDFNDSIFALIRVIVSYALFGTVISFASPYLVLFLTITPLINFISVIMKQKWMYGRREKETVLSTREQYICSNSEDFAFGKDIRLYSLADLLRDIFKNCVKERYAFDKENYKKDFYTDIIKCLTILLRDGVGYAVLVYMIIKGEITVDQFILYFGAMTAFSENVTEIFNSLSQLNKYSLKLCDYREYIDYESTDGSGKAKAEDIKSAPEIVFDHVSFRYDGMEKDTIHDLSFTIKSGEKIALVGLNGAGKTTLIKLLCGLYRPTEGDILINGYSVKEFKREDYYKLFSCVFQDIRTIFLPLAQMVSGQSEEETDMALAEKCIREAGLGEKIDKLPDRIMTPLDKQVHKNGIDLSGGEKQKLMLARALYKNAPILILDEPTAALDPIAENNIYIKYNEMTQNKTSLFVSHRLASTRFCDRIFYFENGQIAEEGTHDSLMKKGGKYAELFDIQSCWYKEN